MLNYTKLIANKKILSWCLFDFANSSYSAVIAAVIFPVYYTNVVVGNETGQGDLWWGRAIALSMAIVAISSPFLGGIADYAKIRKRLLIGYTFLCIASVASFYFLQKGLIVEGFVLIVIANIGMEGALVFYNSFLPEISKKTHQGRVSAWGYAIGYAGSIISLFIALFLIDRGFLTAAWPIIALFFIIFSMPAFIFLPADKREKIKITSAAIAGFQQTLQRLKKMWSNKEQKKFLLAYFIYQDGVNTVIIFSSIFASTTLGFTFKELIGMYLVVQAAALIGAFLMARPIDYWGPKKVIIISLILWITVSVAAFFVYEKSHFFVIASIAGLGLGTVQAATRAFYVQFIPEGQEAEYFGVYSFVGKSSAIIGPLIFGYLSLTFGNQRPAILAVALFFIVGLVLIKGVKGGRPNVYYHCCPK